MHGYTSLYKKVGLADKNNFLFIIFYGKIHFITKIRSELIYLEFGQIIYHTYIYM